MKQWIVILLLLLVIQLSAFDFIRFQKLDYELEDAKENIEEFDPELKVDNFKKQIVLHYCNFFEYGKSLEYLESALNIASKLDSLEKIEASNFMRILSQDKGMQDKVFPKKLTYEHIKEHEDFVMNMLRIRTDICCELENIQLLVKETLYLMHFRETVFKRKYNDDKILGFIDLLNKKKNEITKCEYIDPRRG